MLRIHSAARARHSSGINRAMKSASHRMPATWALSQQWHQGNLQWRLLLLALLACTAALAGAAAWQQRQHSALQQAQQEAQAAQLGAPRVDPLVSSPAQIDFALSLQPDAGLSVWVGDFQRAAARLNLVLVAMTDTPRAAQADQLGRHDVQVTLRGNYPQIKLLLKETLDRHPSTTVARLNMRSLTSAADAEATLTLIRWNRPAVKDAAADALVSATLR